MNPYMDDVPEPEEDDEVVPEGPDESIIPEDEPVERVHWMCSGVAARTHKRKSKETHMMHDSQPSQPTTDASGRFMQGGCPTCNDTTIWVRVTL